ncbi:hypothetical protein ACFSVM_20195 [Paenibacillus shunpengii]|uniref:DUF4190 domain-containing protein n=1 Tax=Paenibacillus shunpengii TaxID=2054424 RepID=A0ABW5SU77_9BACL
MEADKKFEDRFNESRPKNAPSGVSPYIVFGWLATLLSLLFVPILFGAIGVVLGYVVKKKEQKDVHGFIIMVASIGCTILGMIIGYAYGLTSL